MNRKILWLSGLWVAMLLLLFPLSVLTAGGLQEQAPTKVERFSWQNFGGQQVRLMMAQKQWPQIVAPRLPEFEALSGIKVAAETFPENQFRQKLAIELASGTASVDVFMVDPLVGGLLYHKSGWIHPLNELLENDKLTAPEFDYSDYLDAVKTAATMDGSVLGLCSEVDGQIFYYNKELFQSMGVALPKALSEIEEAARAIKTKGSPGIYGIAMRGMGPKAVSQWSTFMANLGGWWVDGKGNAALTSTENIQAFEMYGRLLREYGPPGAANMDWPDALAVFSQGRVGIFCDAASFRKTVVDPSSSRVIGKWSAMAMPAGPKGTRPMTNTWMLSINARSNVKEASWLLVQWLLSKDMVLEALMQGIPAPRASAWKSSRFTSQDQYPYWTEAFMQNLKTGNPQFQAPVINVEKSKDIIGPVITAAIGGENVRVAAEKANKELQILIEEERQKYGK